MLLSLSWLRELTPYQGTAQELADRLTMLGLELEDIRRPYDSISSIVVGLVAACEDHPESDHLHICKVDAGQGELLDIVCGAPNVAEGQKVPVALVGTVMPDGMVIKKAKLRGARVIHVDQPTGTSANNSPQIIAIPAATTLSLPHRIRTSALSASTSGAPANASLTERFKIIDESDVPTKLAIPKLSSTSVRPSTSKPAMVINTGRI